MSNGNSKMSGATAPTNPLIFHITHVDNLPSILQAGGLMSDAARLQGKFAATNIGHLHIKQRRMSRAVPVSAGGVLGDYVPFNFCPRSVMLCAIHHKHDDYAGGQGDVVHLVSSVGAARLTGRAYAFTDRHAELAYARYFTDVADLVHVPWHVMHRSYWKPVREERQAEFLVHNFFPWTAVSRIVVRSNRTLAAVSATLAGTPPGQSQSRRANGTRDEDLAAMRFFRRVRGRAPPQTRRGGYAPVPDEVGRGGKPAPDVPGKALWRVAVYFAITLGTPHQPLLAVEPSWYY